MDDFGLLWINPIEVEHSLSLADFQYPASANASFGRGWGKFAAIPGLYKLMRYQLKRFPKPDEGMAFLMENCDPRYREDALVKARGQKLYMDFCRDIHALGLLSHSPALGMVLYQKALDLSMNIDYLATLASSISDAQDQIGIQSAMRHYGYDWEEGRLETLKEERRRRRGDVGWQGNKIYWLTNRYRRHGQSINGCWLFDSGHVQDLTEEILDEKPNAYSVIPIQLELAL